MHKISSISPVSRKTSQFLRILFLTYIIVFCDVFVANADFPDTRFEIPVPSPVLGDEILSGAATLSQFESLGHVVEGERRDREVAKLLKFFGEDFVVFGEFGEMGDGSIIDDWDLVGERYGVAFYDDLSALESSGKKTFCACAGSFCCGKGA